MPTPPRHLPNPQQQEAVLNEWVARTLVVAAYLLGRFHHQIVGALTRLMNRAAGHLN